MPTPVLQIDSNPAGAPLLTATKGQTVSVQDVTPGPAPHARNWTFSALPGPLASQPTITLSNGGQTATFTCNGSTDGSYALQCTRTEVTLAQFFDSIIIGVPDDDGHVLPPAGGIGDQYGTGGSPTVSMRYGWMGGAEAGTNFMLDAYLRLTKSTSKNAQNLAQNVIGTVPYSTPVRPVISADDVSHLRAVNPSAQFVKGGLSHTFDAQVLWYWDPISTATDDGVNVVKPTDITSGPGRFLRKHGPPKMVTPRDFSPLPANLGILAGLDPFPAKVGGALSFRLSDLFPNLAAVQSNFPLSTAAGDITSTEFSRGNTYDWLCLNEAVRYAEAHGNATIWLDHASYAICGKLAVHGGVLIRGQGSQGSNNALGTSLVVFDTGDLFVFDGTADPFGTGGFSGTGGGLQDMLISKAERSTFGGSSYAGGCALRLAAQSTAKRPGFFWIKNVDVEAESYTPASGWDDCWIVDGINAYDPFNLGVRTIQGHRCRFASCIHDSRTVTWRYVEHVAITGLQIEQGVAPHPAALRIQGDCNNIQLDAAVINGSLIIEDSTPGSTTTVVPVAITNITKASPAVVTATHGFSLGTGNTYAHVRILGITTPQHALGAFNAKVIDATTLWLYDANLNPVDTTGDSAYTSGGTLCSTSPRHVNIQGHVEELDCTAYDAYGLMAISNGTEVTFTSPTSNVPTVSPIINSSPNLRVIAANGPSIQLELFNTIDASETGDNTVFTVTFNQLNFDRNNEGPNGLSGRYLAYIPNCAGTFRLQARVCLRDNTGTASAAPWWPTNTRAGISLEVTRLAGGVPTYSKFVALNPLSQLITLDIEQTVVLQQGDAVRVKIQVFGTAGKNVDILSDSGSGLTTFTAELL